MSAKYRVCSYTEDNEMRLGLCEVASDEDGKTKCTAVASTEVFVTLDEMKHGLERMRAACELPVLAIAGDEGLSEGFEESIEAAEATELIDSKSQ